ncbi:hypothetical protein BVG94_25505 (plasmid) [Serratia marcescens]|uniref:YjeJ family protein n=1 Tax=Serratia marcescens TaxID=615 RepID=UPI000B5FE426|nr:YjeJ family protein [Serratia marcescens]ASL96031.1 hypothetical protein BVG94_25505 [Serratia marcescens]
MENRVIGLITGAIKSEGQFLALATKVRLEDGRDEVLYFAFPKLKGLLFTLQTKLGLMQESGTFNTAQTSQETNQEQARYRQQAMTFTDEELSTPDAQKGVVSISTLPGEGFITLDIARIDGQRVRFAIPDAAIEIFTGYILHTLKAAGGDALMSHAISNLDFMGLYSVEYGSNGELDYEFYNQDPWQMSALKHHMAILYTVKNGTRQEVKCAAIVKTSIPSGTPETLDMAKRVADAHPRLAAYQHKFDTIHTHLLHNPSDQPMELDAALDVLSRLYLRHASAGNA